MLRAREFRLERPTGERWEKRGMKSRERKTTMTKFQVCPALLDFTHFSQHVQKHWTPSVCGKSHQARLHLPAFQVYPLSVHALKLTQCLGVYLL